MPDHDVENLREIGILQRIDIHGHSQGMAGEPAVSLKVLGRACGGVGGASERCRELLSALYERTLSLLGTHREALETLADALFEAESLDGGAAEAIIDAHLSSERPKSA